MNPNLIEQKITKKLRQLYQCILLDMSYMPQILKIAKKYDLPIVEDACQSILGSINNKNAGTWGKLGAFSLHPLKI